MPTIQVEGVMWIFTPMSKLIQGRVKIAPPCDIPKLHTLEPPPQLPGYIPETDSIYPRSSASLAKDDMLSIDDSNFFTGRLTLGLEKAHIIDAAGSDAAQVVGFHLLLISLHAKALIDLGIVPKSLHKTFNLEHLYNSICVTDDLHPLYNKYALYAYLSSDSMMDGLIAFIEKCHKDLQYLLDVGSPWLEAKNRNLMDIMPKDLWNTPTYEIGILLPDHFLPFEQELYIRDSTTAPVSYVRTKIIDKELRIISDKPDIEPVIYPPFSHSTRRSVDEDIIPFFVCINASGKYEHHCQKYGNGAMSPWVDALFQKAVKITDLIFTKHESTPGSEGALRKARTEAKMEREKKRKREAEEEEEYARSRSRTYDGSLKTIEDDMDEEAASDADDDDLVTQWDAITKELEWDDLSLRERSSLNIQRLFLGKTYEIPHLPGVPDPPRCISGGD
ncbi:hypothetical protein BDP27DRAFT_1503181 [Rhodocollybia butyracea]|uniref:Uncharacterized protein n=1 Tax=Rhodocollybia butyracea TaxID=206335 RepID=A0A9P5P504_9AGAR|nr:hypothetical protein BDP27DRAFT_1503181 [Rhodocollybia butyracea]